MRMIIPVLLLSLGITLVVVTGTDASENELDRLRADVEYLCSRELAGRDVPGIEGDMAALWLAQQFYTIGLFPGVNDTSYLQETPLETAWLDTLATHLIMKGTDWEISYEWGRDFYIFPKGLSEYETEFEIDFCEFGIHAHHLDKLDFDSLVSGSAAVVLQGSGDIPREKAGRFALTPFKAAAARRAGAGMLVVIVPSWNGHSFPPDEIKSKITEINNRIVDLPGEKRDFPVVYLDGTKLEKKFSGTAPLVYWLENEGREEPFLDGVRILFKVQFRDRRLERGYNVVGKFYGDQPEYVLLSAHYDHLGLTGESDTELGNYYPGADDNASGVAAMLEICRRWTGRDQSGRGLIAVGFASEEDGLLGSKYFCRNLPGSPGRIVAAVNLDMIGRRGFRSMRDARNPQALPDSNYAAVYYSAASPRLKDIIRGAKDSGGLEIDIIPVNGFPFSDAGSFHNSEIPTVHLFGGFNPDYSTSQDIPDKLDYGKLARTVLLTDRILLNLIEEPGEIRFDPEIRVKTAGMNY